MHLIELWFKKHTIHKGPPRTTKDTKVDQGFPKSTKYHQGPPRSTKDQQGLTKVHEDAPQTNAGPKKLTSMLTGSMVLMWTFGAEDERSRWPNWLRWSSSPERRPAGMGMDLDGDTLGWHRDLDHNQQEQAELVVKQLLDYSKTQSQNPLLCLPHVQVVWVVCSSI